VPIELIAHGGKIQLDGVVYSSFRRPNGCRHGESIAGILECRLCYLTCNRCLVVWLLRERARGDVPWLDLELPIG
jgi:hypothetical protein